ncbi:MAG: hypothetical protein HY360_11850 [Verrucomicrobia bacterium]|nr:hypothetical protein [Verrucomicrobiota bacterium]
MMKPITIAGWLILPLCLVGSAIGAETPFVAAPPLSSNPDIEELRHLKQRLNVLLILNHLNADQRQLRTLYECARAAREVQCQFLDREAETIKRQEEAFEAFKIEDIANQGFSPKTERAAASAEHDGKKQRKRFFDTINAIEEDARQTLTAEQQAMIEEWKLDGPPEKFLFRKNHPGAGKKAEKDTDEKKQEIVRLQKEMQTIFKGKYGAIGPVGRLLICEETLPILAGKLGDKEGAANPAGTSEEMRARIRHVAELQADINLLNLLNGINFSAEQMTQLMTLAEKAGQMRGEKTGAKRGPKPETVARAKELLTAAVACAEQNQEIPAKLLKDMRDLKSAFAGGNAPPSGARKDADGIQTAAREVAGLLQDNQRKTLIDYNPCLIPPKNLKDPVRVGQAQDANRQVKALERVRSVPAEKFAKNKEMILDHVLDGAEEHGGAFTMEERAAHRQRLATMMDEARALSDVDFELQKEDLAAQLMRLDKSETLKAELAKLVGDDEMLKNKIIAHLLHPRMPPLLETRLNQMKSAAETDRVNLDSIQPAESCARGGCALPRR